MSEITPRSYLDSLVRDLMNGKTYTWHDRKLEEAALRKAEGVLLSRYNGWPVQTEMLQNEVLDFAVQDRAHFAIDFLRTLGGSPKLFAVVKEIRGKVRSSAHDWNLRHVDSHAGLIPVRVGRLAAKLKERGFAFDEFLVAEPAEKPSLPRKPKDPVLVGALEAPLGWYLVEVGRWDGFIRGRNLRYDVELDWKLNEKYIFIGIAVLIGLLGLIVVKGFWGFVLGCSVGCLSYGILKNINWKTDV